MSPNNNDVPTFIEFDATNDVADYEEDYFIDCNDHPEEPNFHKQEEEWQNQGPSTNQELLADAMRHMMNDMRRNPTLLHHDSSVYSKSAVYYEQQQQSQPPLARRQKYARPNQVQHSSLDELHKSSLDHFDSSYCQSSAIMTNDDSSSTLAVAAPDTPKKTTATASWYCQECTPKEETRATKSIIDADSIRCAPPLPFR